MKFERFIDRKDSLERIKGALQRQHPQFIVIYGRRRIGKSTLIKELLTESDVYFLSDQTNEVRHLCQNAAQVKKGDPKNFEPPS